MSRVSWLTLAYKELGVFETPGPGNTQRILEYHRETSLKATEDTVPWCSSFICAMFEWSNIPSTRSAAARSWLDWGIELDIPREGCVVVLWRGSKDGPSGHVGLYVGQTKDKIMLLGGNQKDSVCILGYNKDRLLSYRWPEIMTGTIDDLDSSNRHLN